MLDIFKNQTGRGPLRNASRYVAEMCPLCARNIPFAVTSDSGRASEQPSPWRSWEPTKLLGRSSFVGSWRHKDRPALFRWTRYFVMISGPRHVCSTCGYRGLFRVKRRGFLDMFVASATGMRPYFCDRCGRKSYQRPRHAHPSIIVEWRLILLIFT